MRIVAAARGGERPECEHWRAGPALALLGALALGCEQRSPELPAGDLPLAGGAPFPRAACDVLVISLDTTRADVLTFDDPGTAPNLVRLAARGVVFTGARSGSSWTLPAHAQLFTGLPPALHGVHDDEIAIDPRHATLGEHLAARGARTFGVFTGWYLSGAYGFARGYERWTSAMAVHPEADRELVRSLAQGGSAARWAGDVRAAQSHEDVTSERAVDLALAALAEIGPGERWHLFVHLFDPHYDFIPPPPFDRRFDPEYRGAIDGRDYFQNPLVFDPRRRPGRVIGERDLEHVRALYRGEVAWCDAQLGRLLDALEAEGRLERALVIVTADHGEEFFEHDNRGHRQTLYEEVLRVPLLVVPPRVAEGPDPARRGTRCAALTSLEDVLPTILDYAGGPTPRHVWGRSLRPLIEGGAGGARALVASLGQIAGRPDGGPRLRMLEAFTFPQEKLVRRVALSEGGEPQEVESVEWFDTSSDPREVVRVDPGEPLAEGRARDAWRRAEAATEALRRFAASLPRSTREERSTGVRQVFEGELEALGYAGDPGADGARAPDVRWPSFPPPALPWVPAALGAR